MQKIKVKDLINFRSYTERRKKGFIERIKRKKTKKSKKDGGDYWMQSVSTIYNVFKLKKLELIDEKLTELETKIENCDDKRIKNQYLRNYNILQIMKEFDFDEIIPKQNLTFFSKKNNSNQILKIKGLPIQVTPHHIYYHIYSYVNDFEEKEIGAIWFVAKLNGYRKEELGMFSESLHELIDNKYYEDYKVNLKNCVAVDLFNGSFVSYDEIISLKVKSLLSETIKNVAKSYKKYK